MQPRILPVYLEHDWAVGIAGWRFGIQEIETTGPGGDPYDVVGPEFTRTMLCLGPTQVHTSFSAYEVLGLAALAAVFFVAAVSGVVTRFGRSPTAA
jgi:hypothetical protein